MFTSRLLVSFACILLLSTTDITVAVANSDPEVSQELTTLYRASRKVISVNQKHINDASIGDKGLSGEAG